MKTILGYALHYKKSAAVALLLMGLELFVELVQPIIMAIIIDEGIVTRDMSKVVIWGSILLGLSLLAFIGGIVSSYFAANVSQGVGYDVRRDVFTKIQTFATAHMQKFETSSLLTRLTNDVTQIQGFLFMSMRIMLRAPLFVFIGVIMAFSVHARLSMILLVAVPVLVVVMLWIVSKGVARFQLVQKRLDNVNSVISENLVGMKLIKSFHRGKYEENRFQRVNQNLMERNVNALRLMELSVPVIMLGMNASILLILWFGSFEMAAGTAQPGEIVAILNYGTRIMISIGMFSFLMMSFSRGKASASRIEEVLDEPEDESIHRGTNKLLDLQGDITFDQVSFTFPGMEQSALEDIDFHVKPGEMVGILGETGAGKSTLVKLIPRLIDPTSGQVLIDQTDVTSIDPQELRNEVGVVPQEVHLFSGSIAENLRWGNDTATMNQMVEATKEADLHDFIMGLPEQYESIIGARGTNLSGGQKQRLSLARALLRKPKILLLDDSTSALDAHTEQRILSRLKEQHCTIILVAQKISSVRDANQIIILKDGQIVGCGSHKTLLQENSYYQQIYYSQEQEGVIHGG
ncbi:ABC transporter ATP-binding protein [Salinibacillus xinjiangensis]|uniref:ATP-binding cassette domain-containing protein n=1 Tax=Salinibacillus xinjiangensis TaxID=1229268 RepID=A0A6G1X5W7_9BACI|nr:ABC transporter ATP-binding protein [Salinibacillus xinjiangensis]MRG86332.1 ATP-binding cassette domain-containing protein [Salinibacillus xinjiangensis]